MLSISQFFGTTKANEQSPYMARQINLSGNIVNFSMPENFSKDFPADDLLENINFEEPTLFNNKPVELLRRWWDFKDDSFFSKNVGTMMMTIHAYKVQDESEGISHPVKFIKNIILEMKQREKDENKGRTENDMIYYPSFYESFVERVYNNQKWLRSGSGTTYETQMLFHYWAPITEKHYIMVEFNFAPAGNMGMRAFIDGYAREQLENIMETFKIIYADNNSIKEKLKNNSQLKLKQLIDNLK